jgi:hypothetical protein
MNFFDVKLSGEPRPRNKFPKNRKLSGSLLMALTASVSLLTFSTASAFNPTITKLHAKNILPQEFPRYGASVAVGEKWILVGENANDDRADGAGAVHVYNAATRAFAQAHCTG